MSTQGRSTTLNGLRVLVSGGGVGIGRGLALACAAAGADVVIHCYDELAGAASAEAEIKRMGRRVAVIPADLRRFTEVGRLAEQAILAMGGIDVLINNAGITATRPFLEVQEDWFDSYLAVNLKATYFLTQGIARDMAMRGHGVVINIASLHAFLGRREHSVYAAGKGAIVSLTSQLAVELAPLGIRVNAIAPGTCIGENQLPLVTPELLSAGGKALPAGYFSTPQDLGGLAVFLASDAGRYFVGQTLRFDGGYSVLFPNVVDHNAPLPPSYGARYLEQGRSSGGTAGVP